MRKGQPGEKKEGSAGRGRPCVQDVCGEKLAGVWRLEANGKSSRQSVNIYRDPLDAERCPS